MRRMVKDVVEQVNKKKPEEVIEKLYTDGKLPDYLSVNEMGYWEIEEKNIHEFKSKYF